MFYVLYFSEKVEVNQQPATIQMSENNESKKQRFHRIAERRIVQVQRFLNLLGNCGNRNTYDYTEKDIEKVFESLNLSLQAARNKFSLAAEDVKGFKFNSA